MMDAVDKLAALADKPWVSRPSVAFSGEEVAAVADYFGVEFPATFSHFLAEYGGGGFDSVDVPMLWSRKPRGVSTRWSASSVFHVFTVFDKRHVDRFDPEYSDVVMWTRRVRQQIDEECEGGAERAQDLVAFSGRMDWGRFCLDYGGGGPEPCVVYQDQGGSGVHTLFYVAASFDEFVNAMFDTRGGEFELDLTLIPDAVRAQAVAWTAERNRTLKLRTEPERYKYSVELAEQQAEELEHGLPTNDPTAGAS